MWKKHTLFGTKRLKFILYKRIVLIRKITLTALVDIIYFGSSTYRWNVLDWVTGAWGQDQPPPPPHSPTAMYLHPPELHSFFLSIIFLWHIHNLIYTSVAKNYLKILGKKSYFLYIIIRRGGMDFFSMFLKYNFVKWM